MPITSNPSFTTLLTLLLLITITASSCSNVNTEADQPINQHTADNPAKGTNSEVSACASDEALPCDPVLWLACHPH